MSRRYSRSNRSFPLLILVIGVVATIGATRYVSSTTETRDRLRFASTVDNTRASIINWIEPHLTLLRSGAAMFAANNNITRDQFREYVSRLDLREHYPGIQGIGYTVRFRSGAIDSLERAMRNAGSPVFKYYPPGGFAEERYSIVYLEPLDRRNEAAIGYDMFSQATRRAAMEEARDSGRVAATGPVRLRQEIDTNIQRGFLIYSPVYSGGDIPPSIAERRRLLRGFVYSPVRADDLLGAVLRHESRQRVDFKVFDGVPSSSTLLHDSRAYMREPAYQPRFVDTVTTNIAGRTWTIVVSSRSEFELASQRESVSLVFFGGLVLSLLLFLVTRSEWVARAQAEEAARSLAAAKETAESANRAKDHFLAVLSHELRTPLTPVIAALEAFEDSEMSDELQRLVAIIHRNIGLEARLIDDLLDLTRIVNGKLQLFLEPVDVHRALDDTIDMVDEIRSKRIGLIRAYTAQACFVRGDAARLHQVLWNLVKNAAKFTPERGTITLSTRNRGGELIIEVSDNGAGIEPEMLHRIFNAFEQGDARAARRHGGLGLGLAISRMIVEMHGGHIMADSEGAGRGARFTIELPGSFAVEREAPKTRGGARPARALRKDARVLLVDDHADTRIVIELLLRRIGYGVITASGVQDAIAKASNEQYDILVSDIGLPDGTGYDLVRELRAMRPTPAVALSGFGMEEDLRRSREAGFAEHLTKPVDIRRLEEVISGLLT